VGDKLEGLWKEAIVILSQHLLGGTEKIHRKPQLSGFPSKILTDHLNANLQLGYFIIIFRYGLPATPRSA
jgi:hypothetical protein